MDIEPRNLERLFNPGSVAVIGASENPAKLGFHVMLSLTRGGFTGRILPINPGSKQIMGLQAFPSLATLSGAVDLGIVVIPAPGVPAVIEECLACGVKGIVLITAGFKETDDPAGAALHERLSAMVRTAAVPVIGPNTFGMINVNAHLNASFTPQFCLLKKGTIALVSQSGGICHLLGFMAMREDIGFSKIVGIGNRLNVDFAKMVGYLADDPDTEVIALHVEGTEMPRRLIDTAKAHRGKKPIIAYKTGIGEIGNQAARSHTGSLAGRQEIYSGAFTQAGIMGLESVEALLDTAKALARAPLPHSSEVAILSSQAGPGMAGADICQRAGLTVDSFSTETQKKINEILPPLSLRTNPVDMGPAWYNSEALVGVLEAVMADEHIGGILLFMMCASANVDAVRSLSFLLNRGMQKKPIITCLSSPPGIWDKQIRQFQDAGILVNYPTPERAARVMADLNRWRTLIQ